MGVGSVAGCCQTVDGMLRLVLRSQLRVVFFGPTAVSCPGTNQSYCGTAMRKTRGSPCL